MTCSPIELLIDCQGALIRALDDGDVSAVERATASVARALDAVRDEKIGSATERGRFDYALRQAEAARGRVNFLTDRVAQRLDRLTQRRGNRVVQLYTSSGKLGFKLPA
jgi:hypothetical protein